MDGLNDRNFRAPQDASSETLFADGVILWRLSNPGHSDLWCMVFEFPGALYFVVDDDPEGAHPYHVHEQHSEIASLVNRAEALKSVLIDFGWVEVDVA